MSRMTWVMLGLALCAVGSARGAGWTLKVEPAAEREAVMQVLRRRLEAAALDDYRIEPGATSEVRVEVPETADIETARNLLLAPGRLSFHAVDAAAALMEPRHESVTDPYSGKPMLIVKESLLDGSSIASARAHVNEDPDNGSPTLSLELKPSGAEQLALFTREHLGQRMAIVLDGRVLSAPFVQSVILDGKVQISGLESMASAQTLAHLLMLSPLPASVSLVPADQMHQ